MPCLERGRRGGRRWPGVILAAAVAMLGSVPGAAAQDPAGDAEIARIETYLGSIKTMRARFDQVAPDGSLSQGTFYLRRPGRLRIEYDPPTPILVVADRVWIIFEDSELGQVDRFPLSSTPLSILTDDDIAFGDSALISALSSEGGLIWLTIRDAENPEEGALTLVFDQSPLRLRQWLVTDAQRLTTEVTLSETETNIPLDPRLFVYDERERRQDRRKNRR